MAAALLTLAVGPASAQPSPDETDQSPAEETDAVAPVADQAPPDAAPAPSGQPRADFPYGVLLADIGSAPAAHDAGFRVMATTVSWRRTEPSRGQYLFEQQDQWGQTAPNDITNLITAARNNGLKFGLRLIDPPDWAGGSPARAQPADLEDYVYHVVRYAHDSLAYFELFNEQNLAFEWGARPDPAGYARLMAAAHRGAKRADPSVPVINAGPSQRTGGRGGSMEDVDWLDGLLNAGGGASVDALGVHAYLGSFDPSTDPSCTPLCFREIETFRELMQRHGDTQPMYITEMGTLEETGTDLGEFNWMKLTSEARATYLVKALQMANTQYTWLRGATVFNLDYAAAGSIPSSSEQFWFSLLNPDRSPRPAYSRFQQARQSSELP